MYTYFQRSHILAHDGVAISANGHSGQESGRNNPDAQCVHNFGPLPRGRYKIGPWQDSHGHLGPIVAPLTPQPDAAGSFAWLCGRGGFWIHGPELSEGCLVQQEPIRVQMRASGDTDLEVVF